MKILIVEDDETIVEFVKLGLTEQGSEVDVAYSGLDGITLAVDGAHDAILLDLMLPDEDGFAVLAELKRRNVKAPVIVISAKQSVEDKVACLNLGCDDYLTKPFAFSELLARINAIMRRNVRAEEGTRLVQADVSVDLLKRTVTRSGRPVDLKSKEFSLLVYLMENAGQVVTRSMIMKKVWGYDFDPGTNIIDVYVCQLRDKLDREGEPRLIHTVRGSGYVFRQA